MERVTEPANMNRAYQRVVSNKGSAGIDRMTVDELRDWIGKHKEVLLTSLQDGGNESCLVQEDGSHPPEQIAIVVKLQRKPPYAMNLYGGVRGKES